MYYGFELQHVAYYNVQNPIQRESFYQSVVTFLYHVILHASQVQLKSVVSIARSNELGSFPLSRLVSVVNRT